MEELYEINIFDALVLKATGEMPKKDFKDYIKVARFSDIL